MGRQIFRVLLSVLAIVFAWFSFENIIIDLFNRYIMAVSECIVFSSLTYVLFSLLFIFIGYILIKQNKRLSIIQSSVFVTFVFIYIYCRLYKGYVSLPEGYILGYSDAIAMLLVIYILLSY